MRSIPRRDRDLQKVVSRPRPISSTTTLLEAITAHPKPLCVYTDSRYTFGVVHDFMVQWQLRKFLTAAGAPVKHYDTFSKIWQAVQVREAPLSVVKVCAHITKDPNVHERHNNIVHQLAKLAATDGENPIGTCRECNSDHSP